MLSFQATADRTGQTIESRLINILQDIYNADGDSALSKVEELTQKFPNFNLGHLIKGDLLSARFEALTNPGNDYITDTQADELISEAIARVKRQDIDQFNTLFPSSLLKFSEKSPYILILDANLSTLYVFRNLGTEFKYIDNFYASIGKGGTGKVKEGDKKTPIGVYRITKQIDSTDLSDFYGAGAFPINYPNNWDKLKRFSGYGIWVHGSPWDTYSRPPLASDGCIVLSNEDFQYLDQYVDPRGTPIIITRTIQWRTAKNNGTVRDEILEKLEQWRIDWESLDTNQYLGHYSQSYNDGRRNYIQWSNRKRQINLAKKWITVDLNDVSIALYPSKEQMASVTFTQHYKSNNLEDKMSKIQYWSKADGAWKIIYEGKY